MTKLKVLIIVWLSTIMSLTSIAWGTCRTIKGGTITVTMLKGTDDCTTFCGHGTEGGCSIYATPTAGYYYAGMTERNRACSHYGSPADSPYCPDECKGGTYRLCGRISADCYRIECTNQYEADSLLCINEGNIWQGGTCKENHCTAADTTWLTTSIAACIGENNYAIVNTDSTCEHVGTCCDGLDSIPEGNSCKWRCDSVLTVCNGRTGQLLGGVLPDTVSSLSDTVIVNKCYYNCAHSPNPDSSVYLVEGNIVLGGPSDSIPDGIKSQSTFNSVRTETGGVYIYDYLTPAASEYIDSIAAMKCVEHLWRCVINSKYVYWYDNQEVPAGCTNIVRVK